MIKFKDNNINWDSRTKSLIDHDAQGLSGLDNFGFGSIIYDLKEGK